jgi:hypothetical protein
MTSPEYTIIIDTVIHNELMDATRSRKITNDILAKLTASGFVITHSHASMLVVRGRPGISPRKINLDEEIRKSKEAQDEDFAMRLRNGRHGLRP